MTRAAMSLFARSLRTIAPAGLLPAGLLLAGLLAGGVAVGSAQAAPRLGINAVVLATPLAEPRQEIVDGVLWKCAGEQCTAPAQGGRPVLTCGRVARKVGPVSRFASPQGDLTSDELARCNAAR